jgi:nucleoredoxin
MSKFLLLGIVLGLIALPLQAGTPRVWTSKDGSATITATYYKTEAGKVTLILPNGRSQVIDRAFLSDADLAWIDANGAPAATSSNGGETSGASASAKIPAALAGKLIDDRGKPASVAKDGATPKYYLFYYSASWCGPCHAFTPELIQFYRKMKARKASLAVILFPADRSKEDEIAYMKEMRMPWPGVDFNRLNSREIPRSNWGYIPAMVLVDAQGKRLLEVNDELSRADFLQQTEKILREATAQTAQN